MFFLFGSHCACFPSKTLCSDSCTCQDCRNTSDHMSRVQYARKKIEAHDPHAFAPKITDEGTKSSANAMVIPQKNFHTTMLFLHFYFTVIKLQRSDLTVETLCRKTGRCRPKLSKAQNTLQLQDLTMCKLML